MPRRGPPGGGTPTTTRTSRRGFPRPLPAGQVIGCAHRLTASSTPTPERGNVVVRVTGTRDDEPTYQVRQSLPNTQEPPVMITTPTVSGKPGQAPTGLSCDLYPLIGSHSTWTDPQGPVSPGRRRAVVSARRSTRGRWPCARLSLARPEMTPGRAALIEGMAQDARHSMGDPSLMQAQKLTYLLQAAGGLVVLGIAKARRSGPCAQSPKRLGGCIHRRP